MDFASFPKRLPADRESLNPIGLVATRLGTEGNEVSPTHRQHRKGLATREQSKAMVEGVQEEAKSECRSVMDRIGHA